MFSCTVAVRETNMALLVAPNGFHIYLCATSRGHRAVGAAGVQYLLWATETESNLQEFAQRLRAYDPAVFSHTENGVTVIEGLDPDGGRVLIGYPSPFQLPRTVIAARLHA
jgi:hypothetical protein